MTENKTIYADLCSLALRFTQASAVIVAVIDGNQGTGFAVQAREGMTFDVAKLCREMADKLDAAKKSSN